MPITLPIPICFSSNYVIPLKDQKHYLYLTPFYRISDFDDPKDRIVQVCRWYLSAYHAGRKSAVAKKPYNPILGEVFQCHWDIPGKLKRT